MKCNEFEGLYADDEAYEDYINRKLSESVQYKPKEDTTMSQYYNYEVEDENKKTENKKTENNKSIGFTGEILAAASSLLFFGGLLGTLLWILGTSIGG